MTSHLAVAKSQLAYEALREAQVRRRLRVGEGVGAVAHAPRRARLKIPPAGAIQELHKGLASKDVRARVGASSNSAVVANWQSTAFKSFTARAMAGASKKGQRHRVESPHSWFGRQNLLRNLLLDLLLAEILRRRRFIWLRPLETSLQAEVQDRFQAIHVSRL